MDPGLILPSSYISLESVKDAWTEGLLVLMYHAIDVPPLFYPLRGLYVSPRHLERQLRELQEEGKQISILSDWKKRSASSEGVVLTFDDAYRNVCTKALPVLKRRNVKGLTYVVASLIGKSNEWDRGKGAKNEPLMDSGELCEWIAAGQEIGSHGLTHRALTSLTVEEAREEIFGSKKKLEDTFQQPINHFCYPYGCHDQSIRDLVEEAGYETATTILSGLNSVETDPFLLKRFWASHRKPWLAAVMRG